MKVVNIIIIDGEEFNFDELSRERQEEIAIVLNDRALATLGYGRKEKIVKK